VGLDEGVSVVMVSFDCGMCAADGQSEKLVALDTPYQLRIDSFRAKHCDVKKVSFIFVCSCF
jgi:hypothetical protein